MADTVAHAKVLYTGDDKKFKQTAKRVDGAVEKTKRNFKRLTLAVVASSGAMALMVKKALDATEAISDMANKANANVEALQELRFAATQNGAATRDMDDALTRLTRRMSLFAMDGGGPAANAIKALNLEILDSEGNLRKSDEVFMELTERFGQLKTDADKTAIASQLFGEDAGPRLVPLLNQGTAGLAEFIAKARDMGIVLDEAGVRKAAAVNAQLRALGDSMRAGVTQSVIDNIDAVESLATSMEKSWIPAIGKVTSALTPLIAKLGETLMVVLDVGRAWDSIVPEVKRAMGYTDSDGPEAQQPGPFGNIPPQDTSGTGTYILGPDGLPIVDLSDWRQVEEAKRAEERAAAKIAAAYKEYGILRQMGIDFFSKVEEDTKSHGDRVAAIKESDQKNQVKTFGGFLDAMVSTSQGAHQRMFKALAMIAGKEGLINTYRAAALTLADGSVPFWGKAAAVGAVLSQGMGLVSSIQSISGVSGGGGAASPGGGAVAPAASTAGASDGQYVNLNLVGDMFGRDAVVALIAQLNEAVEDGAILKGVRAV